MKNFYIAIGSSILGMFITAPAQASTYIPIDFSSSANFDLQSRYPNIPKGNVTFGGIPFSIPTVGNNTWHADSATGNNSRTLTIPVNIFGVQEVNTLINTYWGISGPNSYASIEFFGSGGAYYKKELVGNDDIRDFLNNTWTNSINETTTIQVYFDSSVQARLDKQQIVLPNDFNTQTLNSILISDNGGFEFQRIFVAGVTAKAVPEPITMLGVSTAVGFGAFFKRKMNSKLK